MEPPEDGEMIEMTLSSRHRIRNSSTYVVRSPCAGLALMNIITTLVRSPCAGLALMNIITTLVPIPRAGLTLMNIITTLVRIPRARLTLDQYASAGNGIFNLSINNSSLTWSVFPIGINSLSAGTDSGHQNLTSKSDSKVDQRTKIIKYS